MPIALTVLLQYFLLKNERGKLMGKCNRGKRNEPDKSLPG